MRETEPAASTAARTKPATAADRLVSGQATAFGLGRIGEPADTAAVVAFLASEEAGFVTGQVIYNVGGQHGPIRRLAACRGSSGGYLYPHEQWRKPWPGGA